MADDYSGPWCVFEAEAKTNRLMLSQSSNCLQKLFNYFRFNFEEGLPAQNFDSFVKALLTVFQVFLFMKTDLLLYNNIQLYHQEITGLKTSKCTVCVRFIPRQLLPAVDGSHVPLPEYLPHFFKSFFTPLLVLSDTNWRRLELRHV